MATPFYLPDAIYTSVEDPGTTMQVVRVDDDDYILVKHLTAGPLSEGLILNEECYLTQIHFDNPELYWTRNP